MNDKFNLDEIKIASPCRARWEDMGGDDRARFCGQCQKHVYNFSAMTRGEVENLIREKEGRLCGRFYRRADGRVLTADCPSESRGRRNRLARLGSAVLAFLFFLLSGCARHSIGGKDTLKITPLKKPFRTDDVTVGMICVPTTNSLAPTDSPKK